MAVVPKGSNTTPAYTQGVGPRLDGRCEWNRGGLAFRPNGEARGVVVEYVEACREPTTTADVPWCEAHRCEVKGCDNARVVGTVCVGHMPGSLRMAREARQAAPREES